MDGGMSEDFPAFSASARPRVALFATCVVNMLRPQVAQAALELLRHSGCAVEVPEQGCCGQPAFNAGYMGEARVMAQALVDVFAPFDAVVAPSASCAGMVRHHLPGLFAAGTAERTAAEVLAARTFELCAFLHHNDVAPAVAEWRGGPVLWHDSCASLREMPGAAEAALALLARIPGLELILPDAETRQTCCGFGGLFSVKMPEVSTALARRKLEAMLRAAGVDASADAPAVAAVATGASAVTSTGPLVITGVDMGCLAHLAAVAEAFGLPLRVMHVAEILAGMGG